MVVIKRCGKTMFRRWSLFVCVLIPCLCQHRVCAKEVCKLNEAPNPWSNQQEGLQVKETVKQAFTADMTSFNSGIGESAEGSASWNLWHQSWETLSSQSLDISSMNLVHGITFDIIQHYQVSVDAVNGRKTRYNLCIYTFFSQGDWL